MAIPANPASSTNDSRLVVFGLTAIRLLRLPTYLLTLMYLILGGLARWAFDGQILNQPDWELIVPRFGLALLILAAWYINATAVNDWADHEIDRINLANDPSRPLVIGLIGRRKLLLVAASAGLLALVAGGLLNWQSLPVMAGFLLINLVYSLKPLQLSRRGGWSIVALPLSYAGLPLVLGWLVAGRLVLDAEALVLLAALYSHFLARIILKDYRDVVGDRQHGKITFLLRHGNRAVCSVSIGALVISLLLWLVGLGSYLGPVGYQLVFLTAFASQLLYQLSRISDWGRQRAYLAFIGRVASGLTALVIVGLIGYIWQFEPITTTGLGLAITLIYLFSGYRNWKLSLAWADSKAS